MIKKLHILAAVMALAGAVNAQNVGIGTNLPHSSAKLQIDDANRGILIPRVSLAAVTNGTTPVASPLTGLLVYNTNAAVIGGAGTGFYFWNGTQWTPLKGGDNTLDMAYDEGGPGAGRIITADAGRVEINGTGGLLVNANTTTLSEAAVINNTNGTSSSSTQIGYVGVNSGNVASFGIRTIAKAASATALYDGPMGVFASVEAPTPGGTINLNTTTGSANKATGIFGSIATTTSITGSVQDMIAGVVGYTGLHNSGGGTVTGSKLYGGLFGGNGRVLGLLGENSAYMEFLPGWQNQNYETAMMGFYNTDPNGGNNGANIGTGDSYFSIESNITNTTTKNLVMQTRSRGNVGIGTATPADRLHVTDAVTPNTATVRISGLSSTGTLTSLATDAIVMTDANGSLRRANEAVKDAWYTTGNATTALRSLGTTTNQSIDLITNNVVRGRLTNQGEFFIGATATVAVGDLMNGVSNATFPWAVNGYSANNGSGVYGSVTGGTTIFAGVQGEYSGTNAQGAGVRGLYLTTTAGTSFAASATGVLGQATAAGSYKFGVYGSGGTSIRSGGVLGYDYGVANGALGYYASNLIDYAVYGFGQAHTNGTAAGRTIPGSNINNGSLTIYNDGNTELSQNSFIGLGIYGGVMGGWVRGLKYGFHAKGQTYGLYVDGQGFTNKAFTYLMPTSTDERVAGYMSSSMQPEVSSKGKIQLNNGQVYIAFDNNFKKVMSSDLNNILIVATPQGNSNGVYIDNITADGFWIRENNNGRSNVQIVWTATTPVGEMSEIAEELLNKEFDRKMENVMYNDNNTNGNAQPLWWDGTQMRWDTVPAKQPDPNATNLKRPVGGGN
jgi:hypothetical protein